MLVRRHGLQFGMRLARFRHLGSFGPLGRGRGIKMGSLGHLKPEQGAVIAVLALSVAGCGREVSDAEIEQMAP